MIKKHFEKSSEFNGDLEKEHFGKVYEFDNDLEKEHFEKVDGFDSDSEKEYLERRTDANVIKSNIKFNKSTRFFKMLLIQIIFEFTQFRTLF